jgi:class 3 adenylate cyclase
LISQGEGISCLILFRPVVRAYPQSQIALVETFAEQAVIAIENVWQFRELQAKLDREAATRKVLQVIGESRDDEQPVFDTILENACRLCEANIGAFVMGRAGDAAQVLVAHNCTTDATIALYRDGHYTMEKGGSYAADAIHQRKIIHVENLAETDYYIKGDSRFLSLVDEQGIRTILYVPLISQGEGIGCLILFRPVVRAYTESQITLVETFAEQAVIAIGNVQQFRALESLNAELGQRVEQQVCEIERMSRFRRFLSPAVAEALVSSGDGSMLSSHRALIATLFCDIRGFTAFCERAEPEETIELLQAYHEEMGKLISAHDAGVDKRMGDGIMVVFNDPFPCEDPTGSAVQLALTMRERMAELCKQWKRLGHSLDFGMGISLGCATIGMVGSEGRYD